MKYLIKSLPFLSSICSWPQKVYHSSTYNNPAKIKRKYDNLILTGCFVSLHVYKWKSLFKLLCFTRCQNRSAQNISRKWILLESWGPAVNQCFSLNMKKHMCHFLFLPTLCPPLSWILIGSTVSISIILILRVHSWKMYSCAILALLVSW